ncbi:MAG: efflux RND transporter periplasmic adaptor subunit [Deltaproteobacteria bacterium]|nr:efflux RND transporter periplasmic adaptor subunit [Deltaproteobacteria bacterium]
MKRYLYLVFLLVVAAGAFLAGSWYSHRQPDAGSDSKERRVLYYVDPMNPVHASDKPGIAPCGMPMEPVYADGGSSPGQSNEMAGMPPGTVRIGGDWQQLFGVKVATVEKKAMPQTIRILGRVAVDETRIYRINAATDGWIKKRLPVTTGSLVRKDELLATFYAPEFFSAMKAYLYGLRSLERFQKSGTETKEQLESTDANIENYRNALRNLGMTEHQLDEIRQSRQGGEHVEIRAPAAGFVQTRNITLGERFQKGTELYRIADLKHVWILADIFENEEKFIKPGAIARVFLIHRNAALTATVSNIIPQFDPVSRTLNVRLDVDNPNFVLKPDMFVDVDFPVSYPPAVTAPIDAIIDSGLRNTVFVDLGNGFFEPRKVETGWRSGDRVEIINGLSPGERIVVSGGFLIDSESRMKAASAGIDLLSTDPICGYSVNKNQARAEGRTSAYRGKTYYFFSDKCKESFEKDPDQALSSPPRAQSLAPATPDDGTRHD